MDDRLPVDSRALDAGFAGVRWPGRLESVATQPVVVLDAAHNPDAVQSLLDAMPGLNLDSPRILVFGALADKDWPEMLCRLLPAFDHAVFVPIDQRRAQDPRAFAAVASGLKPFSVAETAGQGVLHAKELAGPGGSVVVAGSIFLIGEIYADAGGGDQPFERDAALR
jgi:dihydrofolate synthase/folylpolyglutamate synthase